MSEQEQGRTEQASPHKLEEARKQGQVARSADFNAFVVVAVLLTALMIQGRQALTSLAQLWAGLLQASGSLRLGESTVSTWLLPLLEQVLQWVVPFGALGAAAAVAATWLQTGGPLLTFHPLKPSFERINPVAGFKRLFSLRMLFEAIKTGVKLALFAAVLTAFARELWPHLMATSGEEPVSQLTWFAHAGQSLLLRLCAVMLVIALADLVFVRWQFGRQMRMSRREIKEEHKRREGDPHVRARLRELQRENLKQARSLGRVPDADVIITNPEHLAIALKYVRGSMSAPCVLAKGADTWAMEMRRIAASHGIPRFERRSLARHLFRHAQLERPIPPDSFVEVARVYADLEARRRQAARYEVQR